MSIKGLGAVMAGNVAKSLEEGFKKFGCKYLVVLLFIS